MPADRAPAAATTSAVVAAVMPRDPTVIQEPSSPWTANSGPEGPTIRAIFTVVSLSFAYPPLISTISDLCQKTSFFSAKATAPNRSRPMMPR